MSEYVFQSIRHELPEYLLQKTVLWIWNADKIPPHIGISSGKDYFSLTYRKSEKLLTVSMLKKAKRSLIPLVLVEIPAETVVQDLNQVFSSYNRAVDGVTCMHPIREVMQVEEQVHQLVDLLIYLETHGMIRAVNGINLPLGYRGIPDYSMEDILSRIASLNRASKK